MFPKVATPSYELTLPSSGRQVKFRPFLSSEEKMLLMAKEDGSKGAMINTVKDIIDACTYDQLKPGILTPPDFEWIFLKLYEKSVGNVIELSRICAVEDHGGNKCNGIVNIDVDVASINPPVIEPDANIIKIDDVISVVMNYPTMDFLEKTDINASDDQIIINLMAQVISGSKVYDPKDAEPDEVIAFLGSMNIGQKSKLRKFISDQPQITATTNYKCIKCGNSGQITFKGLKDFFG